MANSSLTKQYNDLPFLVRVIVQLVFGFLAGGIYRVVRYTETKNTMTLIFGMIGLFTVIGNAIFWFVDLVTLVLNGKYTVCVD